MWIRSQDRKKLTEIHDVTIYRDKQIWAGCSFIGEYSTKEKALSVLDEIQRFIYHIDNLYATFQMPQDEDAEV